MKIDIRINNLLKSKQMDESKGKDFDWPTDPVRPGDDPEYVLDVAFYDGTTKPDQEDETGYSTVDYRKQFYGDPINIAHPGSAIQLAFNFYQNSNTVRAEDILQDWDGGASNRDYGIFDRRPMEKIYYSDFIANKEVVPVGVSRPDFEITLKYPDNGGQAVKVNHRKIFKGGVEGATADVLTDDTETTGYRIWSPPLTTGHIKLEEKTMTSVFAHIGAAYGALEIPGKRTPLIMSEKVSEVDNIAWIPFDTSDDINFKMTREPSYEAEEFKEPPVKMLSQYSRLRVFVIPRKWWVYLYKHEGMEVSDPIHCWGVWIHPPKDFAMPVPRKKGVFELGHVWDAVEYYSETPIDDMDITDIVYSEGNAHALFTFEGKEADGDHDSDERNSIYTLYAYDSCITVQYAFGQLNDFRHAVYMPGGEFDDFNSMWACWLMTTDFDGGHISPSPTTGFIKTMPDMKEPLAVGERVFHPWKGIAHGEIIENEKVDYTRRLKAYTEADGAFQVDGIEAREKIYTAAIEAVTDSEIGLPANITSWGVGAGAAKEKDLVAVLESGDGNPIYVWRKTDEEYRPATDFYYQSGATYYMSNPENFIFSGRTDGYQCWNVTGVIEWPFPGEFTEGQGYAFNRKVTYWGTYCTVRREIIGYSGTDDPIYTYYAYPHRYDIELDPSVLIIACFSMFPNAYSRQLWTE